jgi:hypothetical protein
MKKDIVDAVFEWFMKVWEWLLDLFFPQPKPVQLYQVVIISNEMRWLAPIMRMGGPGSYRLNQHTFRWGRVVFRVEPAGRNGDFERLRGIRVNEYWFYCWKPSREQFDRLRVMVRDNEYRAISFTDYTLIETAIQEIVLEKGSS